jgi:hypothetical protein
MLDKDMTELGDYASDFLNVYDWRNIGDDNK